MQPLNLSFRRLLYRNIRKLKPIDVAKFERLTALRHQLTEERRFQDKPNSKLMQALNDLDKTINDNTENGTLKYNRKLLKRFHRAYIKTRKVALQQNHFFQIPVKNLVKYLSFLFQYKVARTRRVLWWLGP